MYCPSCGGEYREGYRECADCEVPLVDQPPRKSKLRRRISWVPTVPEPTDDRPNLVRVLPGILYLCGVSAVVLSLLVLWIFWQVEAGQPDTVGVIQAEAGEDVSNGEILALLAPFLGVAALCFVVAVSFWREEPWSRHLLVGCLALEFALLSHSDVAGTTELHLFFVVVKLPISEKFLTLIAAGWYFYVKKSVRDYYRELQVPKEAAAREPLFEALEP